MLQSPQGAQGLLRVTWGRQPGIWGTAAELGAVRVLPSIARSSRRWGASLWGHVPGWGLCRTLVGSPARAGSCHCHPLPVGFTNCISNFCRYFKEIFPKAVCITDTLSLRGCVGWQERC